MATLDGMQLFATAGLPTSGGAFLLTGPSKASRSSTGPDGWTAEIKEGSKYVVAWKPKALSGHELPGTRPSAPPSRGWTCSPSSGPPTSESRIWRPSTSLGDRTGLTKFSG